MGISMMQSRRAFFLSAPHIASANGASVQFEADMAAPMNKMAVTFHPTQTGYNTPSPTNVRPLTGRTSVTLIRPGRNIADRSIVDSVVIDSTGATRYGLTFYGPATYVCSAPAPSTNTYFGYVVVAANGTFGDYVAVLDLKNSYTRVVTLQMGERMVFYNYSSTSSLARTKQLFSDRQIMIEIGETATSYEEYSAETTAIALPSAAGTVYAGTLDLLAGTLAVYPYYASYDGEALVGPWISSMDVYAPGITPTTGAEVVDLGGAPTVYTMTPTPISAVNGRNAFTTGLPGNIAAKYWQQN